MPSTSLLKFLSVSAIIPFIVVIAPAQFAAEPTALNSNLFPVNANGEVRFLSVLSSISSGILLCISSFKMASSVSSKFPPTLFSTCAKTLVRYLPINIEIMAGGASLAPRR